MPQQKVIFRIGEETHSVVETWNDLENSIFRFQYEKAFNLVEELLKNYEKQKKDSENINNIISFIGERGTGKTSCMKSVLNMMKELPSVKHYQASYPTISETKFYNLETLDPSFFDMKHNILDMLVGEMYKQVQGAVRKYSNNSEELDRGHLNALREAFQKAKRDMHYVSNDSHKLGPDEELEELAALSAGIDLQNCMKRLVETFLKFFKKEILIISIDDIDLNVQEAYKMVEQIRKYLILPNVVILIAVKLDQLGCVIQQTLNKQFDALLKAGSNMMNTGDISEMTERYLSKLFPIHSRIYIPQIESFYDSELMLVDGKSSEDNLLRKTDSVRETVPRLIFEKCRYLFYNTRGTTSLIVPRNLRDLRLLILMLYEMDGKGDRETLDANKTQFKRWFFNSWVGQMDFRYQTVAKRLINQTELTLFNKTVLDLLRDLYEYPERELQARKGLLSESSKEKENTNNEENSNQTFIDILNEKNVAYNISLGDVFYVLNRLEKTETSTNISYLLFFIKSLYSIKLYELYDKMINMEEEPSENNGSEDDTPKEGTSYRGEKLKEINNYRKLIGGSFYSLDGENLIQPERKPKRFREIRLIKGNRLIELIKEIEKFKPTEETENKTGDAEQEFIAKLRVVEFFMLSVSRYVWTTESDLKESGIHKYRLLSQVYYDRKFGPNTESLCFDLLVPFFTLTDIKHAYSRFSNNIFNIARGVKGSLYNLLYEGKQQSDFLSSVCLRNAEVIDELYTSIALQRGVSDRSGSNEELLRSKYQRIFDFKIATYNYSGMPEKIGECKKISFPAFGIIANLFKDKSFVTYFLQIYEGEKTVDEKKQKKVTDYFKTFLDTHKSMKLSTIIHELKQCNHDFFTAVREETIRSKFNKDKSYSKKELERILSELLEESGLAGTDETNEEKIASVDAEQPGTSNEGTTESSLSPTQPETENSEATTSGE